MAAPMLAAKLDSYARTFAFADGATECLEKSLDVGEPYRRAGGSDE